LEKVLKCLNDRVDIRNGDWDARDIDFLNEYQLLTAKPVVYLVNITRENFETQKNRWLKDIMGWVQKRSPGAAVIPFSVTFEVQLSKMEPDARKALLEEKKVKSMLPKIITTGYSALELVHFFTTGTDEVRAWTVKRGASAPQAAGVIHTDFEKGFIHAETMAYEDFKKHGSEAAVKAAGRYRTEGKNYAVKDGDILFFKSTLSKASTTRRKG